jgi:hypothetical protein
MAAPNPIEAALTRRFPQALVSELIHAHAEAKKNLYLGGLRLSGVEGGRFCEASYRMLEHWIGAVVTPLGKTLDTTALSLKLAKLPYASQPDSIRLHIPRALRVVYDVRNQRDVAHLADGINPNFQDATLVCGVLDWVLAEWVRLAGAIPANDAQKLVDGIVERKAPVIQDFDGFLKVLNPNLKAPDFVLILLYQRGGQGATDAELMEWVLPRIRSNLSRTLSALTNKKAFIHRGADRYQITQLGVLEVETRRLFELP